MAKDERRPYAANVDAQSSVVNSETAVDGPNTSEHNGPARQDTSAAPPYKRRPGSLPIQSIGECDRNFLINCDD